MDFDLDPDVDSRAFPWQLDFRKSCIQVISRRRPVFVQVQVEDQVQVHVYTK